MEMRRDWRKCREGKGDKGERGIRNSPVYTAPKSPIAYQIYGCFCLLYFFELVVEKMNSGCTKIGR